MQPSYRRYILLGVLLMVAAVVAGIFLLSSVGDSTPAEIPTEQQVLAPVTTLGLGGGSATTRPGTTQRAAASGATASTTTVRAAGTTTSRPAKDANGFTLVRAAQLPKEAQQTLALIDKGGPYPYTRDGVVFENREKILPAKGSGYYHEYTVVTPGSSDRGARRVIVGSGGERYYTADHYDSFVRVEVGG